MTDRKVVLVHGYSDRGASFVPWAKELAKRGFSTELIEVVTYKSLTNEVTIKDLAEGFDRALRNRGITEEFDAIVHSTGMLVVRAWLTSNRRETSPQGRTRMQRLRHLIGFAPATWGSPLAHRGRGLLGSIFKGNKSVDPENAPDFLESGDLILDGLELASRFTWDLAHADLFGEQVFYGQNNDTPYPFIFCGNEAYGGIRKFINEPGTDGTVRFAGVSLDSVKFSVDLTVAEDDPRRIKPARPNSVDAPVIFTKGNHATILKDFDGELPELVVEALKVDRVEAFEAWKQRAEKYGAKHVPKKENFQHFVIRLTDERGDPIDDFNVQLLEVRNGDAELLEFDLEPHPYGRDKSLRSFHVDLAKLKGIKGQVWMRITVSSGTILVAYHGVSNHGFPPIPDPPRQKGESEEEYQLRLDARPTQIHLDLSRYLGETADVKLFWPFTTTLVEIKIDREPLPFGPALARLCRWEELAAHDLTGKG